jgi:hypothetical protein
MATGSYQWMHSVTLVLKIGPLSMAARNIEGTYANGGLIEKSLLSPNICNCFILICDQCHIFDSIVNFYQNVRYIIRSIPQEQK